MMFQDYALFPHRTVAQNVAFGLRMRRVPNKEVTDRTQAILDLVGLADYGPRSVGTLSGGEQQRVALARTLAPEPRLVLLDEPLGALDRALRERLVEDMREIFETVQTTALYVTHDREEAFAIADRVAIIDAGHIIAAGTPEELWYLPTTARAAELIGLENRLSEKDMASLGLSAPASALDPIVIAPSAITLSANGSPNGTVIRVRFRGGGYRVTVEMDGGSVLIASSDSHITEGTRVRAGVDPSRLSRFGE
jgi:thiamine transport system ATP-binding protein